MIGAMKRAALALVLAACSSSTNDFPALPGGSGPGGISGGGTVGDGGITDGAGDGGGSFRGSVCLVKDLRAPTSKCDPTKAGGFTVTLGTGATGTVTATTATDGSFVIAAPNDAGLPFTWHVTGRTLTTSVMLGAGTTIPAILVDDYTASLADIGLPPVDANHGSVLVQVVNAPVAGITAAVSRFDGDIFYDGGSVKSPVWNNTTTQSAGVVWVPTALPGPVTITLTRSDKTIVQSSRVVESQAITFVTQDLQ